MGMPVMPVIGIIGDKADPISLDASPFKGGDGVKGVAVIVKKSRNYGHSKHLFYSVSYLAEALTAPL
jgi:hypothetical protein